MPGDAEFMRKFRAAFEKDKPFAEASTHDYACKCAKCQRWWFLMGIDPDTGEFGPFTREEMYDYAKDQVANQAQ